MVAPVPVSDYQLALAAARRYLKHRIATAVDVAMMAAALLDADATLHVKTGDRSVLFLVGFILGACTGALAFWYATNGITP